MHYCSCERTYDHRLPSNPALDFAQSILDETRAHRDSARHRRRLRRKGQHERPHRWGVRQNPQADYSQPSQAPTDDNDVGALREAPSRIPPAASHEEPESPKLGQSNGALHRPHRRRPFDPSLSNSLFNSIFSPSPTTARCYATSCWKSPGPKTIRGSRHTTAQGNYHPYRPLTWHRPHTRPQGRPRATRTGPKCLAPP